MKQLALFLAVALLASCGKSGPPRPPLPLIPKSTSDLVVAQRGPKVILNWSYPSMTTSGRPLTGLSRIVIYRYLEGLPASLMGRSPATRTSPENDPSVPAVVALFSEVPPLTPQQFARLRERIDAREAKDLPSISFGGKLIYEDEPPLETTDGRPSRATYAVVTEGSEGKSDLSNLVSIVPLDTASAPENFTATATGAGVVLNWSKPAQSVKGRPDPRYVGYNLYRFPLEGSPVELGSPVNPSPVKETTFTDVPPFGSHRYLMTAVSLVGPPQQEGDPAGFASAEFRDLQPPPPPVNVVTLVEERAIRILWDPVEAPDFAGYKLYRSAGSERVVLTKTATKETSFRDATAVSGVSYVYAVTSLDDKGNESAPASTSEAMIPR